jgi:hypothetical protein
MFVYPHSKLPLLKAAQMLAGNRQPYLVHQHRPSSLLGGYLILALMTGNSNDCY